MAQLDVTKEFIFVMQETLCEPPAVREQAVQHSVEILFQRQVADAYVNFQLDREVALQLLGPEELSAIECDWQSDELEMDWALGTV